MASFEYIKETDLKTTFNDAKAFMSPLHEPLDEFERIARNRPHPGIAKDLPKVTDGTLAALIQDQPKRVVQQIPTGKIVKAEDWLNIVGSYILENEILPNNNQVAAVIQKCWALINKTLTYGAQPTFVQFVNRGDYFGTDWTLPYIKDVFLEPGKLSDRDSNVIFLRTWLSKSQIDAIIYKENLLAARAKKRGEKYESTWKLDRLEKLKETMSAKDPEAQTANERAKAQATGFIELVHVFQRGVGANFYSFSPKLPEGEECVRVKVNPDPRGYIPIHFMYANVDFSNPLGRGSVEMSAGMQNLLDSEVQMYQYNRALLLNPPMIKKGDWSSAQAKYRPNALIDLGTEANADFKPLDVDNSSIQRFPENYGLMRSQILNLNSGGGDTQTSASVGNPGFSKTDAGVDALQERLGFSDNYIRKMFEDTFEEILETSINLYFAERSGMQELKLDQETAAKLRKVDPEAVDEDGVIEINYDTETKKLKFQIDASSSMKKDNSEQLERAKSVLELTAAYPQLDSKAGGAINTVELTERIISAIGLENPEKIIVKPEEGAQDQQQQMTPEMVQQIVMQVVEQAMAEQQDNYKQQELELKAKEQEHKHAMEAAELELKQEEQAVDTALRVGETQHKIAMDEKNIELSASDRALKIAQAEHSERTGDRDHEFKVNDTEAQRQERAEQAKQAAKVGAKS